MALAWLSGCGNVEGEIWLNGGIGICIQCQRRESMKIGVSRLKI